MLTPDNELVALCQTILATGRTLEEWRQRESDDEFQSAHYVGGYDATEDAFCFSYYESDAEEWWFQLSLDELRSLTAGASRPIEARRPTSA